MSAAYIAMSAAYTAISTMCIAMSAAGVWLCQQSIQLWQQHTQLYQQRAYSYVCSACVAMSATHIRYVLLYFGGKFKAIGLFFDRRLLFSTHTTRVNNKTLQNSVKILHLRVPHNLYNKQPLFRFHTFRCFITKGNSYFCEIRTAFLHTKGLKLSSFSLKCWLLLRT